MSKRTPWLIAATFGCAVMCLLLVLVGVTVIWLVNQNRQAEITPTLPRQPVKDIDFPKTKIACEQAGGKWGRIGLAPTEQCNLPTSDAGRMCADSSECEGLCIAELSRSDQDRVTRDKAIITTSGKCAPWRITVGCIPLVEQGKVKAIWCFD